MPQLVYVKNDKEWTRIRRRGRFSIPRDCARSEQHLSAAVRLAQQQLVSQLEREGHRYVGAHWDIEGPLDTIDHFLSDRTDEGPYAKMPEITNLGNYDRDAMDAYERAEKARVAWTAGENTDMVDYRVIGTFEVQVPTHYRAHVKETRR